MRKFKRDMLKILNQISEHMSGIEMSFSIIQNNLYDIKSAFTYPGSPPSHVLNTVEFK